MIRRWKTSRLLIAGLLLAAAAAFAAPAEAQAQQGCVWDDGGRVGSFADYYTVRIYYQFDGSWNLYGTYNAAKYADGSVHYGGADYAVNDLRSRGVPVRWTYNFRGRTYR